MISARGARLNALTISKEGLEALKKHEAVINGLYDDSHGVCNLRCRAFVQKFKSVLLDTAKSEKLCQSRVAKKWRGTSYETPYLEREAYACTDFPKLKAKAGERAPEIVSRARYGKPLEQLPERDKVVVRELAQAAVREETRLIHLSVDTVLLGDLKRFERAVNDGITTVCTHPGRVRCAGFAGV